MIAIEALVKPPQEQKVEHPVATDQQIEQIIEAMISHEVDYVRKPFRASSCYGHELFKLTPDGFTHISNPLENYGQKFRVEPERAQRIGMEVMRRYGFDEEVSGVKDERDGGFYVYEKITTTYPSQTVEGLTFERVQTRNVDTKEIHQVIWRVNNRVSIFKFNPVQALLNRSDRA